MQFHQITKAKNAKTGKRVGRGGSRGKTSGRGTKGQKARAGHRMRPEMRDIIKKIPKLRGHGKNRSHTAVPRTADTVVNFTKLEKHFAAGEVVSPATLLEKGLIRRRGGKMPKVKILGTGALTKKITFEGVTLSKSAENRVS